MYNSEHRDLQRETLLEQFDYIATYAMNITQYISNKTYHYQQHAQQFGDLSITELPVSQFLGPDNVDENVFDEIKYEYQNNVATDGVHIRDRELYLAQKRVDSAGNVNEKLRYAHELQRLLDERHMIDKQLDEYVNSIQHLMPNIATNSILHTKQELNNRHCYRQLVDTFHQNCYILSQNPYVLSKLHIFVNICEQMRDSSDADIATYSQNYLYFVA
ncbi:unnamed protein product, partial [Oppiella nova]